MKTNYYQKLKGEFNLIYNVDIFLNKETRKLSIKWEAGEYDTFEEIYNSLTTDEI